MNTESSPRVDKEKKTTPSPNPILGVILRIILVLVFGLAIGAAIYFSAAGWLPYLDQRLFEPIEKNQEHIQEVAATQQALMTELAVLAEDLEENRAFTYQDLEAILASAELQVDEIQASVEFIYAYSLTQVPVLLATITTDQQSNETHISALATAQLEHLRNRFESEYFLILALLSRSNQYLLHDNYGLAEDQLLTARQILLDLGENLVSWERVQALELLSAIEGAIADLPAQPGIASEKLELAWQLTLLGIQSLPNQGIQGTPLPTPGGTITPTPSP
jgi:hypothetical protein